MRGSDEARSISDGATINAPAPSKECLMNALRVVLAMRTRFSTRPLHNLNNW